MGTHPIFESDFDCLTEGKQLNMVNIELMTDAEREEYFNRPESFSERWAAFTTESYFSYVINGVKAVPGKYKSFTEGCFNTAPVVVTFLLWGSLMSERYGAIS